MKLITEVAEAEILTEAVEGKKYYYIEGKFLQSEIKNRNGRIYPKSVMESAVEKYSQEKLARKNAYGELGHPAGPTINPERISHLIEKLEWQGNDVIGRAKILDTAYGVIAQKILEGGGTLGVSSRGLGSLRSRNGLNEVQSDFYLSTAADIVTDPSAPEAFVNGIMEDAEWIYKGGAWVPVYVEESQKKIHNASKAELTEVKLEVFKNFLSKL